MDQSRQCFPPGKGCLPSVRAHSIESKMPPSMLVCQNSNPLSLWKSVSKRPSVAESSRLVSGWVSISQAVFSAVHSTVMRIVMGSPMAFRAVWMAVRDWEPPAMRSAIDVAPSVRDQSCFWTGLASSLPDVPIRSRMMLPLSFVVMKKSTMLMSDTTTRKPPTFSYWSRRANHISSRSTVDSCTIESQPSGRTTRKDAARDAFCSALSVTVESQNLRRNWRPPLVTVQEPRHASMMESRSILRPAPPKMANQRKL
mmetsp:Transcript_3769/g.9686  ORF Transcript_3769/g.9686 Transcript_3769/m.9686 type:complete len:255 (+) Transcript_3769:469-1233(+)